MAKKKSSSSSSSTMTDSDTPPSPDAMGLPPMDGGTPPPTGGKLDSFYQQHKAGVIGGTLALVAVAGYILYREHQTSGSSGSQSGTTLPVTDILSPPSSGNVGASAPSGPGGNSNGVGSNGYGGNGTTQALEQALTLLEDEIQTQSSTTPSGAPTTAQGVAPTSTTSTATTSSSALTPAQQFSILQNAASSGYITNPIEGNATASYYSLPSSEQQAISSASQAIGQSYKPSEPVGSPAYGTQYVPGGYVLAD